jgi:UDP-4-amino-4,6-dideoxy-N-acetyl-beta-L-altrosamine transaminase
LTEFLPYGRQTIDEADIAAVNSALADPLITQGPRVESFERAFSEYVGARHAVAFANGTAALHAAAHAAGLGPGDELLTTPLSFIASANCALFLGARPRFCDIDPDSANLDLQSALRHGLPQQAKACVAVSMAGLPIDLEPLQEARREGLVVIEDASHALGARRAGLPVGGDGAADMTTFSFHPVKAITSGEGGMVSTDDDVLAGALRSFRTHGISRDEHKHDGTRDEHEQDVMRGGWHYDIDSLGFNYRITDFQCALGEQQLTRLDEFIAARRKIADRYRELLGEIRQLRLPAAAGKPGTGHAYHLFVVRFREGASRRRAAYEHLRARGIGVQLHYIPIPVHGLYRSLGYTMEGLPATQAYYEEALSLPIFPAMTDEDVQRVTRELRHALDAPRWQAPAYAANTVESDGPNPNQSVESLHE